MPELVDGLSRAIWSELAQQPDRSYNNRDPYITSVRRNLQRRYLEIMIGQVLGQPGRTMPADAHAVIRMTLGKLSARIGDVLDNEAAAKLDDFSRAHLQEAKARTDKALAAEFEL